MKYLKCFEGEENGRLWKRIEAPEVTEYISNHNQTRLTDKEFKRVIDIFGYNHNLTIKSYSRKILIKDHTKYSYSLYLFEDEYFLMREERYKHMASDLQINNWFLIDGWDGLDQIISRFFSLNKIK